MNNADVWILNLILFGGDEVGDKGICRLAYEVNIKPLNFEIKPYI